MRLSVVIPALNEERHLGQLLSDIKRQSRRPEELIVVDAGSTDATVHIAQKSGAVVLHSEPPVARGRNLGGYSAKGDLIFFLDADTRLPGTFLEDFVCDIERRRLDIACPRYLSEVCQERGLYLVPLKVAPGSLRVYIVVNV